MNSVTSAAGHVRWQVRSSSGKRLGTVENEIAAWFDASTLEEEKSAARRLNKAALDHALFAPLGVCMRHYAWRKSLTGITRGPMPLFWGVSKTV